MDARDSTLTMVAKALMAGGLAMVALGVALWLWSRFIGERRLPGDIVYESNNMRVYMPLGTCLLLSAVLSALMWLWGKLR